MTHTLLDADNLAHEIPIWKAEYLTWKSTVEFELQWFLHELESGSFAGVMNNDVLGAISYDAVQGSGKRIRGVLVQLVCGLVGGDWRGQERFGLLAELPHRGSLIEDDIDDHALTRDGRASAWSAYSTPIALEAAQLLYEAPVILLRSYLDTNDSTRERLTSEYEKLSALARKGQAFDIEWTGKRVPPSESDYLEMCRLKCAAFDYAIFVGTTIGQATDAHETALRRAGELSAIAFQLRDDLISTFPDSSSYGDDLREEKMILPVIHALNENRSSSRSLKTLIDRGIRTDEDVAEAIALLDSTGSRAYTQEKAQILIHEAESILKTAGLLKSSFGEFLRQILHYGIHRTE